MSFKIKVCEWCPPVVRDLPFSPQHAENAGGGATTIDIINNKVYKPKLETEANE